MFVIMCDCLFPHIYLFQVPVFFIFDNRKVTDCLVGGWGLGISKVQWTLSKKKQFPISTKVAAKNKPWLVLLLIENTAFSPTGNNNVFIQKERKQESETWGKYFNV